MMVDIRDLEAAAEARKALRDEAIRDLSFVVHDFVVGLQTAWTQSTRHTPINRESLTYRLTDELLMAAIAFNANVGAGALPPATRELRYILEQSVKYAYVDQLMGRGTLEERIEFLRRREIDLVGSARSVQLSISTEDREALMGDIGPLYGRLSEVVHPSAPQLEARLKSYSRGGYIGHESEEDVRELLALALKVFDIALLYFVQPLGFGLVGDLITQAWEERVDWTFHHTPLMAALSSEYNYKHERQGTKAGPVRARVKDLASALTALLGQRLGP